MRIKKNGMRKNRNSNYLTIFKGNALFMSLRTVLFLKLYKDSKMSKLTLFLSQSITLKESMETGESHACSQCCLTAE